MAFSVEQAFNSSAIIADAGSYPDLRLFTVKHASPTQPAVDVNVSTPYPGWAVSNGSTVGGPGFGWFSAVCFLFGRDLHVGLKKKIPVGLVASNVGGTYIQLWSSYDALDACGGGPEPGRTTQSHRGSRVGPATPGGALWNGMICPLLPFAMRGAIW